MWGQVEHQPQISTPNIFEFKMMYSQIQSGASSRAKHGGAYFSGVYGSIEDPMAAPITGQYCVTFDSKISPWSCFVLELYKVLKHNTSKLIFHLGWVSVGKMD